MIQLVCKGEEGQIELEILRRFSRPDIAFHPDNHIIHLLDEVAYLDMVFAVCPLLRENIMSPWYYDVREVLDAVCQAFKVGDPASSARNMGLVAETYSLHRH